MNLKNWFGFTITTFNNHFYENFGNRIIIAKIDLVLHKRHLTKKVKIWSAKVHLCVGEFWLMNFFMPKVLSPFFGVGACFAKQASQWWQVYGVTRKKPRTLVCTRHSNIYRHFFFLKTQTTLAISANVQKSRTIL